MINDAQEFETLRTFPPPVMSYEPHTCNLQFQLRTRKGLWMSSYHSARPIDQNRRQQQQLRPFDAVSKSASPDDAAPRFRSLFPCEKILELLLVRKPRPRAEILHPDFVTNAGENFSSGVFPERELCNDLQQCRVRRTSVTRSTITGADEISGQHSSVGSIFCSRKIWILILVVVRRDPSSNNIDNMAQWGSPI